MNKGDEAFFYASSCAEPGIVGKLSITSTAYPDATFKEAKNPWMCVDVAFEREYKVSLPLQAIKEMSGLGECALTQKGSRLSVIPLSQKQFQLLEAAVESRNSAEGEGKNTASHGEKAKRKRKRPEKEEKSS